MPPFDRDAVIAELEANLDHLERVVSHMSAERMSRRPAPDRWSPLEVLEHLTVVERGVHRQVTSAAALPPSDLRTEEKDRFIEGASEVQRKISAPDFVHPTSRFGEKTLEIFRDRRTSTINLARTLDLDWRAHHAEHPLFGTLDIGQWFLLAARHGERHIKQMLQGE